MVQEHSCGGILFTKVDGVRHYVLVMEASGTYGFPKGHVEGNETDIETAKREIFEETGIVPVFLEKIKRTIRYKLANSVEKEVTFFAAKFENQEVKANDKLILATKLLPLEQCLKMLKFQELKNILVETDFILESCGE